MSSQSPTAFEVLDSGDVTYSPAALRALRIELQGFLMAYEFGLREVETKLTILRDEFLHLHEYNPIEHVSSRVKSPEGILEKVRRKGIPNELAAIRSHITDIAGVRVTCSFVSDVHRLFDLFTQQDDVHVVAVKDYIAHPK
ncbi:MAG: GTP pyrophosphokinase family protein, partial [Propioniciclava sp.]